MSQFRVNEWVFVTTNAEENTGEIGFITARESDGLVWVKFDNNPPVLINEDQLKRIASKAGNTAQIYLF